MYLYLSGNHHNHFGSSRTICDQASACTICTQIVTFPSPNVGVCVCVCVEQMFSSTQTLCIILVLRISGKIIRTCMHCLLFGKFVGMARAEFQPIWAGWFKSRKVIKYQILTTIMNKISFFKSNLFDGKSSFIKLVQKIKI